MALLYHRRPRSHIRNQLLSWENQVRFLSLNLFRNLFGYWKQGENQKIERMHHYEEDWWELKSRNQKKKRRKPLCKILWTFDKQTWRELEQMNFLSKLSFLFIINCLSYKLLTQPLKINIETSFKISIFLRHYIFIHWIISFTDKVEKKIN